MTVFRTANLREHERLIIFTRLPVPHQSKTHLIPALGADGAAALQQKMTEYTLFVAKEVTRKRPVTVEVRYTGNRRKRPLASLTILAPSFHFVPQGWGDLGRRMRRTLSDSFRSGTQSAVIIGADIPDISPAIIERAFDGLKKSDLVIGPATDGGYYLIGTTRDTPRKSIDALFSTMPWGGDDVFKKTMTTIENEGLRVTVLKKLSDIDRPEDLPAWESSEAATFFERRPPLERISVIIPTINEARNIEETIRSARETEDVEIIVVDGGSTDDTVTIARAAGATVISEPPPRARQMNRGAERATGDILLFLHGDTQLPAGCVDTIHRTLREKNVAAGAFSLTIGGEGFLLRLVEKMANLRSRRFALPYGDQGLFLSAELFSDIGGFSEFPIMEDYELVRRLNRIGEVKTTKKAVTTSPRRWQRMGVIPTTIVNQLIIIGYHLGISAHRLSRWYHKSRGKKYTEAEGKTR
jgi:rSAM/selenodomain-associated transferase 2/rSAM/selenodomain-associated transferase 1